jgi:hypothetical protein
MLKLHRPDFRVGSDTGYPEAASIAPIMDGESVNEITLQRSDEGLRTRTESLRNILHLGNMWMQYAQSQAVFEGGTLAFTGAAPTDPGTITISSDLYITPFTTGGGSGSVPYLASTAASLTIGASGTQLIFTSVQKQYEGSTFPAADPNNASIEMVDDPAQTTCTVSVEGATGQKAHVLIKLKSGTCTCLDVINGVAGLPAAAALVTVVLGAGTTNGDNAPLWGQAEWGTDYGLRFLNHGNPAVVHKITAANLASFFSASASNLLQAGDTIAISYNGLVDETSTGGRFQSTPENGNTEIPHGSIFNTRREPNKVPDCVPIAKCINATTVMFADGTLIQKGVEGRLGAGAFTQYAGVGDVAAWTHLKTGTHSPPTTIRQVLNNADSNIITVTASIATVQGNVDTVTTEVVTARDSFRFGPLGSLDARLEECEQYKEGAITVTPALGGGHYAGVTALQDAVDARKDIGGVLFVAAGTYTWTAGVSVTKQMHIICSGVVTINCSHASGYALTLSATATGSTIHGVSNIAMASSTDAIYVDASSCQLSAISSLGRIYAAGQRTRLYSVVVAAPGECIYVAGNYSRLESCNGQMSGTPTNKTAIHIAGNNVHLRNIFAQAPNGNNSVHIAGYLCVAKDVRVYGDPRTAPASADPLFYSTGINNSLENIQVVCIYGASGSAVNGAAHITGNDTHIDGLYVSMLGVEANPLANGVSGSPIHIAGDGIVCRGLRLSGLYLDEDGGMNVDYPIVSLSGTTEGNCVTLIDARIHSFGHKAAPTGDMEVAVVGAPVTSGAVVGSGYFVCDRVIVDTTGKTYDNSNSMDFIFSRPQPGSTLRDCNVIGTGRAASAYWLAGEDDVSYVRCKTDVSNTAWGTLMSAEAMSATRKGVNFTMDQCHFRYANLNFGGSLNFVIMVEGHGASADLQLGARVTNNNFEYTGTTPNHPSANFDYNLIMYSGNAFYASNIGGGGSHSAVVPNNSTVYPVADNGIFNFIG